jgi:hypothetical protein
MILLKLLDAQEDPDNYLVDDGLFEDDQVDQWEAVPLQPPPPTEEDLMRDSDELYSMFQSKAKNDLEREERLILQGIIKRKQDHSLEEVEAELNDEDHYEQFRDTAKKIQLGPEFPTIFNTDDFDDDYDDVPADAPFAPPIK